MNPSHREPTHPGEMLIEEFLRPSGITQIAAAHEMRIPLNRLNEIIRGKRGVTADTAVRLAKFLGTSAEFWMNLQTSWDIYAAAKRLRVDLSRVHGRRRQTQVAESTSTVSTDWALTSFNGRVITLSDATESVDVDQDAYSKLVA